jgi:HAD superfamily hydrolase (TIGR01484 family)
MINLNNKKIVAFDLDGTLAESKQHLEPFMSKVLCALAKKKLVAIISGGSINQFKKQFLPYFFPTEGEEDIISSNLILLPTSGSQCYEYDKEKSDWIMTDVEAMPEFIKNKILLVLKDFISPGKWNFTPAMEGDNIIEDRVTQIAMSALGQNAPIALKKVWDPDQKKRQQMKIELEKELPEVNIIIGGTTTLDILPKGFDKAKGLLRLLAKLGMSKEDMVFVGDSIFPGGNDYSPYEAGIECIKVSGPEETVEIIKKWL